jgi:hypothetical protein
MKGSIIIIGKGFYLLKGSYCVKASFRARVGSREAELGEIFKTGNNRALILLLAEDFSQLDSENVLENRS